MASAQDDKQIASRYVTALFDLAKEQKKLDKTAEELAALADLLGNSSDFAALCNSPVISRQDKEKAVQALAKKTKLSPIVSQFLTLLAENQRLALLGAITAEFASRLREHHGEIVAEVQTAAPIDAKTEKSLAAALSKYTGKTVTLDIQEKPEILGGLRLFIGGRMIDASVSGKLQRLQEKLNQGIKQIA